MAHNLTCHVAPGTGSGVAGVAYGTTEDLL